MLLESSPDGPGGGVSNNPSNSTTTTNTNSTTSNSNSNNAGSSGGGSAVLFRCECEWVRMEMKLVGHLEISVNAMAFFVNPSDPANKRLVDRRMIINGFGGCWGGGLLILVVCCVLCVMCCV
jgi:hypothetical protein